MGLTASGRAQPLDEVLDFEELQPKCVASVARGDWGTGPVRIKGTSDRYDEQTNVAVVVDTEHPESETDLRAGGYHNALIVSRYAPAKPPEAPAWAAASVKTIDDDNAPGGVLSFDFQETGPVTFYGLTLLDHDDGVATIRIVRRADAVRLLEELEPGTHLELSYGGKSWFNWLTGKRRRARLTLPADGQLPYRLQVAPIAVSGKDTTIDVRQLRPRGREARALVPKGRLFAGGIPDVTRIEVRLGGSSAVDDVLFRHQGVAAQPAEDDLFSKIQSHLSEVVAPQLEERRAKFVASWNELAENPTPTLRSDLDALLVGLQRDLIGTLARDGERSGGLLHCPKLPCGCPELRALQAWVAVQVEGMRADLANASDQELEDLATLTPEPTTVQIAALEPARYLAALQPGGRIELAQRSGGGRCRQGTFGDRFACKAELIVNGTIEVVASLFDRGVELTHDRLALAGAAEPCPAYRLTPMSREFSHVETGILPDQSRRVPRGLYCVLCRTADGLRPRAKLDLVTDRDARPEPLEGAECAAGS